MVTESWFSTREDLDPLTVLTNFPQEREMILVVGCNAKGEEYSCYQEFTHQNSNIVLIGKSVLDMEKGKSLFIAPVQEVWKNNFH